MIYNNQYQILLNIRSMFSGLITMTNIYGNPYSILHNLLLIKYKLLYREQNWYFHIYFSSIELLSNKLLHLTGSINEKLKYIMVKTRFSLGFNETTIE